MTDSMPHSDDMYVIKRSGAREPVSFDKVLERIRRAAAGLSVNYTRLAQLVLAEIHDEVHTSELDELAARMAISFMTIHPDWGTLAAQIIVSNCQRSAPGSFSEAMAALASLEDSRGRPTPALAADVAAFIEENKTALNDMVAPGRDFLIDYFGFKTLEKAYLMRGSDRRILETPQYMWLRVSVGIWGSGSGSGSANGSANGSDLSVEQRLARIQETYDLMSQKAFTHATPTLFNSGTPRPQLSSCFIAGTPVHTMNGVKPIEEVVIGDEVVTHTGAVKRVLQLHENPLGERKLFDLKIAGTPTFTVTENHRLMSLSDEQEKWGQKPTWNRVDYLRVGDWVAVPKKLSGDAVVLDMKDILGHITGDGNNIQYTYEYDDTTVYPSYNYFLNKKHAGKVPCRKTAAPFNRYWRLDEQTMELLGVWYGDGSVTHGKNSQGNAVAKNINIVAYHTNTELIMFVLSSFRTLLGESIHITQSLDSHGMVCLSVNHTIIAQIFKDLFKCRFDGKRIPAIFNHLGYKEVVSLLAGLVSSDGCVASNGSVQIQLTNPPLVKDIFHLARSVGIPITLTMMTSASSKATGRMNIPYECVAGHVKKYYNDDRLASADRKHNWCMSRDIDGVTFLRINAKSVSDNRPEYVYTLGVEDDHSYSVGGIIAENCFLVAMREDSLEGIFDTLKDCAQISKYAGGIGLHVHNIRAAGSHIAGTNGTSDGLLPMLRVFNNTARYINQGGRRNGSFAVYLEPWHADIQAFLKMKSNTGSEEERARDLFYALWIPDLFMKRVEAGGDWSLFCPHEAPGLADVVGDEFEALYTRYEAEGRARRVVPAQKIWSEILVSQIETGTPYLLYKDAANLKSNQKNLGVIKSSNLCTEIIEYSSPEETAVCNLASIALPYFLEPDLSGNKRFNFDKLRSVTAVIVRNLNRVIDINFYPTPETRRSNMRHRPIGLGVQGLADVFAILGLAWETPEAAALNQEIFENIYFAAVHESCCLAAQQGAYETFRGSPASLGQLQPDLWANGGAPPQAEFKTASYLDWAALRTRVVRDGLRNSLLLAPMPTASTSQILGYNECIEPFTTNIYVRRTLAGEFTVINRYLVEDLMAAGLWSTALKDRIVAANGSVQAIPEIPDAIKARYKTVWEIKQKTLIDMAADRGAFICQSQSLNLFVADPTIAKLSSMHFYAWKRGLKTGLYYLRTKSAVQAIKFTVEATAAGSREAAAEPEECLLCSA